MTENPPPPSGTPEGGGTPPPPPPQNPYGAEPTTPPPAPQNPYASQPPPPADPYAGNPPTAGQSPYGADVGGQNPYGASSYPVTPGEPTPVAGSQPGGLGQRFLARLVDGIIFAVVTAIISAVLDSRIIGGIIGGVLYLCYYVYLESSRGRTLGKQVVNLRVHGPTGGNPTMDESFRRNAWYVLGIVSSVPILGLITGLAELVAVIAIAVTISQDPLKRGWHDKFGNTTVTRDA